MGKSGLMKGEMEKNRRKFWWDGGDAVQQIPGGADHRQVERGATDGATRLEPLTKKSASLLDPEIDAVGLDFDRIGF